MAEPGPDPPPVRVAVVGSGSATDEEVALARAVGGALAGLGAVVVTGGLGGVMAAASRGAAEAGGWTLGFLPGRDPGAANPWVRLPVATGLGEARNVLVVRAAEAVVAVGGSWGTLSEVAFALRTGVPVLALGKPPVEGLPVQRLRSPRSAARRSVDAARARRNLPPSTEV